LFVHATTYRCCASFAGERSFFCSSLFCSSYQRGDGGRKNGGAKEDALGGGPLRHRGHAAIMWHREHRSAFIANFIELVLLLLLYQARKSFRPHTHIRTISVSCSILFLFLHFSSTGYIATNSILARLTCLCHVKL
jgi:hypothetical protein